MSLRKIIFTHGGGRFGNQLINYAHLLACGLEYKNVKIQQQSLQSYLLPKGGKYIVNRGVISELLIVRTTAHNRYYQFLLRLIHNTKIRSHHLLALFSRKIESIVIGDKGNNLGHIFGVHTDQLIFDQNFIVASKPILLLSGWGFRNWSVVDKWKEEISSNLLKTFAQAGIDKKSKVLGVHIRGTDFKTHANGQLYFNDADWIKKTETIVKKFNFDKVILMSDEDKDWTNLIVARHGWAISTGSAGKSGDMYDAFSDLLSCDLILTAGSTFALMAAWISDAKVIDVADDNTELNAMNYYEWKNHKNFLLNWK